MMQKYHTKLLQTKVYSKFKALKSNVSALNLLFFIICGFIFAFTCPHSPLFELILQIELTNFHRT